MTIAQKFVANVLYSAGKYKKGSRKEPFELLLSDIVNQSTYPEKTEEIIKMISDHYESLTANEQVKLLGNWSFSGESMHNKKGIHVRTALKFTPGEIPPPPPRPSPNNREGDDSPEPTIFGQELSNSCCSLSMVLAKIKVVTLTEPRSFRDDVAITAITEGEVLSPNPSPFAYPLVNGKIEPKVLDTGESDTPGSRIFFVRGGEGCRFRVKNVLTCFEVDSNKIDEALRQSVQELQNRLLGAAGMAGFTATAGLISQIIGGILDLLGLKDDVVGQKELNIEGILDTSHKTDSYTWECPGYTVTHDPNGKTTTLVGTFVGIGGKWEVTLIATRICSREIL